MDNIIYFFYENGFDILLFLAIVKIIFILLYRFDISYVVVNFFMIFTHEGIEVNPRRTKFRRIHNILTMIFYLVLILWVAISFVIRVAR